MLLEILHKLWKKELCNTCGGIVLRVRIVALLGRAAQPNGLLLRAHMLRSHGRRRRERRRAARQPLRAMAAAHPTSSTTSSGALPVRATLDDVMMTGHEGGGWECRGRGSYTQTFLSSFVTCY